jgi:hypothetical protein
MQRSQSGKQSEDEIVSEIRRDELSETEVKRRVRTLITRHLAYLEKGLRTIRDSSSLIWHQACKNLGVDAPGHLIKPAVEYLVHVSQKGENQGIRRICTYLDDGRPFGKWLSSKMWGLARDIQEDIIDEVDRLERSSSPSDPKGPTPSRTASSITPADAISGESEMDRIHFRASEEVSMVHYRFRILLDQLDRDCRAVLFNFFLSEPPPEDPMIRDVESCLRQLQDVMKKEDVEPMDLEAESGMSELWSCAMRMEDPCRKLILGSYFLELPYRQLGKVYSNKSEEEYETKEQYERAEIDWVGYRIRSKCRKKIEESCGRKAVRAIRQTNTK